MKAVSIRQPWAWFIVYGGKTIENRSRPWHYRGEVAIHASKLPPARRDGLVPSGVADEILSALVWTEQVVGDVGERCTYDELLWQSGAIVGTARVVDCVEHSDSPWFTGPYGLVLEDVRPTPIIPCRGALGLWTVPPEVERRIREGA